MTEPKDRAHFGELYARTVRALVEGRFRPGDRIGVKQLAGQLSASTTPAREILSRLVGCGLVEEHRSEGYYLRVMDQRRIMSLYRLHGLCIEEALRGLADVEPADIPLHSDAWTAFDMTVEATGDTVLVDVRRFLDTRLSLLRRCEARLVDDLPVEAAALIRSFSDQDRAACRRLSRMFHRRRIALARQLASCVARR